MIYHSYHFDLAPLSQGGLTGFGTCELWGEKNMPKLYQHADFEPQFNENILEKKTPQKIKIDSLTGRKCAFKMWDFNVFKVSS